MLLEKIRYFSVALAMAAFPGSLLYAAQPGYPGIDSCQAEVNAIYGKEVQIKLVSKRRTANGLQVKLSAQIDRDQSEFLVCWVPDSQAPDYTESLAVRVEPVSKVR